MFRLMLPLALVAMVGPAFAQDRTLPAGSYPAYTTPGDQRVGVPDGFQSDSALQQGRSEAPVAHRARRSTTTH